MSKIVAKGLTLIVFFFSTWFGLKQVDWIKLLKVKEVTNTTEEKLGNLLWKILKDSDEEITSPFVVSSIDSILQKICAENNIDHESLQVHILKSNEINAFALPNRHLVIYTGLIAAADNQEELTGVICHEIAHIERNHVMNKLVKEVGLAILIPMATGNSGIQIVKETAELLSSTAYDRSLEKDADLQAVQYLTQANINPEHFANFLYKLSDEQSEIPNVLSWISTHPDSKERASYVIENSTFDSMLNMPILAGKTWEKLNESILE